METSVRREGRPQALRPVDWEDLRVFLQMAEAGSLGRAARRLRVSSATVARRIGNLEADLGVVLFVRRPCGYSPTSAGRDLACRLAELPDIIETACGTSPPVWSFRSCVEAARETALGWGWSGSAWAAASG